MKYMFKVNYWIFILVYVGFSMAAFQRPLFSYLASIVNLSTAEGLFKFFVIEAISILLWIILLGSFGVFSRNLLKLFSIILLFINAVAVTLMVQYSAIINKAMIGNIIFTDTSEASGFINFETTVSVLLLAVPPSMVILLTQICPITYRQRFGGVIGAILMLTLLVTLTPQTTKWIDKNGTNLGSRLLPWSYIGNGVNFYRDLTSGYYGRYFGEFELLPDSTIKKSDYNLVVLVIGESARAKNFSHYGYERPTNQFTMDVGYVAMPVSESCDTHTMITTGCILSVFGKNDFNEAATEPLPSYLQRQGISVIVRTNNTEMPRLKVENYKTSTQLIDICKSPVCLNYNNQKCTSGACIEQYQDNILLADVDDIIAMSKSQPVFLLMHLRGSHGPNYAERSPEGFNHFLPICRGHLRNCTQEELYNTYDNTIAFTDWTLAQLATILDANKDINSFVLYLSDHGESLGEDGKFMHGAPLDEVPAEQIEIPFLIWANNRSDLDIAKIKSQTNNLQAQDVVFHTVLGALGMRSGPYKQDLDILN